MTIYDIAEHRDGIRTSVNAYDYEAAHDQLHKLTTLVLLSIADGQGNARQLAAALLDAHADLPKQWTA